MKATSCKTLGIPGLGIEEKQLTAYFIIDGYKMIVFYVSNWYIFPTENFQHPIFMWLYFNF